MKTMCHWNIHWVESPVTYFTKFTTTCVALSWNLKQEVDFLRLTAYVRNPAYTPNIVALAGDRISWRVYMWYAAIASDFE